MSKNEKKAHYDWDGSDDSMKAGKRAHPIVRLHTVCEDLRDRANANISMKMKRGNHRSKSHQNDWDNSEHIIKVINDMKFGKIIDHPKNWILEQNTPEKKTSFFEKPKSVLNSKNQKPQKSNNQSNEEERIALLSKLAHSISASVGMQSHILHPSEYVLDTGVQATFNCKSFHAWRLERSLIGRGKRTLPLRFPRMNWIHGEY